MQRTKYRSLERNIIDIIKEEQIKLGYRSETVRLYYPLSSLNKFIGEECDIQQMHERLKEFCGEVQKSLGMIEVSNKGSRFCLAIPPEGIRYVHHQTSENDFLVGFIKTIQRHGCSLEDIRQVFLQYSENIHVEKMNHGDFDYLLYFEDGKPDSFRYCITFEECHVIYHRYTIADYEEFEFSA